MKIKIITSYELNDGLILNTAQTQDIIMDAEDFKMAIERHEEKLGPIERKLIKLVGLKEKEDNF